MNKNDYFKNQKDVDVLFAIAFESLAVRGSCKQSQKYFDEAFCHNPYHFEAHALLAKHYAASKNIPEFKNHFYLCLGIDSFQSENLLSEPVIVENLPVAELDRVHRFHKEERRLIGRNFYSVKPLKDDVELVFKQEYLSEIQAIYDSWPSMVTAFFTDGSGCYWPREYSESFFRPVSDDEKANLANLTGFFLESDSNEYTWCETASLFSAIKALSPYVEDVRFLLVTEVDDFVDEIIIENGLLSVYRHDNEEAVDCEDPTYWEQIIERYPDDHPLRAWIVSRYSQALYLLNAKTNIETAQELLQKIIKYSPEPDAPWIVLEQAKLFLLEAKNECAFQSLAVAVKHPKAYYEVYNLFAELQFKAGNYSASIDYYSQAIKCRPAYLSNYSQRGLAHLHVGNETLAISDIEYYIDEMAPHNYWSLIACVSEIMQIGFKALAVRLYNKILLITEAYEQEISPKAVEESGASDFYQNKLSRLREANVAIFSGLSLCVDGFSEKLKYSEAALKLDPNNPELLFNMGTVFQEVNKQQATLYYERALIQSEDYIKALNNKGMLILQEKQYQEVIIISEKIIKINQDYPGAWLLKGSALFFLSKLKEALKCYENYRVLLPECEKGYHGIGLIYSHLGKREEAIPYLNKALEIAPEGLQAAEQYSNLASCYCGLNDFEKTIDTAEKSIAINPNFYHPYFMLACCYAKQGDKELALPMIRKTIELDASQKTVILELECFDSMRESKAFKRVFLN